MYIIIEVFCLYLQLASGTFKLASSISAKTVSAIIHSCSSVISSLGSTGFVWKVYLKMESVDSWMESESFKGALIVAWIRSLFTYVPFVL